MAVLLESEKPQPHPEGWEPDPGPYLKIDKDVGRGIGNIAIVGSFESPSSLIGSRLGMEAAERLAFRGIIGMNKVLGMRIIYAHGDRPHGGEYAEESSMGATIQGLYVNILERKYANNGGDPILNETRLHEKWLEPLNIKLLGEPHLDRFQLKSGIFQAWEDFNDSVEKSELSDSEPEERSLVIVTSPAMGPILDDDISESHLLYGKVLYPNRDSTEHHWLPDIDPLPGDELPSTREQMLRTGRLAPLRRDSLAYSRRMMTGVRQALRSRQN